VLNKADVSRILRRHGLARLAALEPPPPVRRYTSVSIRANSFTSSFKKLARIERVGQRMTGDRQRDHVRGAGWQPSGAR